MTNQRRQKLGNTLRAANNHYNETVTGLVGKQGLYGKIERFQQVSTRANKEMVALEAIHDEIETDRLGSTVDETESDSQTQGSENDAPAPDNVKAISGD